MYMDQLVQRNQISTWSRWVNYLDTGASAFLLLQTIVVVCFYRFGRTKINFEALGPQAMRMNIRSVAYGILAGLAVFLASLPLLFVLDRHVGFVSLLTNDFFKTRSVLLVLLFAVVLPIATEAVFRGIILRTLLENTTLSAAVLASSLLFAYVWPIYNAGTAFLLGIASAILYYQSRSLVPGILANVTVTVGCAITLVVRSLQHN